MDQAGEKNRVAILGASRGFGQAFAKLLHESDPAINLLLVSRKIEEAKEDFKDTKLIQFYKSDFSNENEQKKLFSLLEEWKPTKVFYFAGGGPFGYFDKKAWKDHLWALEVNFLFPAQLVHWAMQKKQSEGWPGQLTYVGSSVAENNPEPFGASYGAAKKAMRALVESIRAAKPSIDLRLFSPGYMDTALLPKNASPRQEGAKIYKPQEMSLALWGWVQSEDLSGHREFFS